MKPVVLDERRPAAPLADLSSLKLNVLSEWTKPTIFFQHEIDAANAVSHDDNPIHRATLEGPAVLPGMVTVASLPRYLGSVPVQVPGYQTVYRDLHAKFLDFLLVEDRVVMRYLLREPITDRLGSIVTCDFHIRMVGSMQNAVEGTATLQLIPDMYFNMLLRRARTIRMRTPRR